MLEADPEDRRALEACGVASLLEGDRATAQKIFDRVEASEHGDRVKAAGFPSALMDPEKAARGEPYVAVLKGAVVDSAFWMVLHGNRAYWDETSGRRIGWSPFIRHRVSADNRWLVASVPRELPVIEEPCLLIGSDPNYAHWVMRYLFKLALVAEDPKYRSMRMLMQQDLLPWQREYLELLGIEHGRVLGLPKERMVYCREVHVPTQLRLHPQMRRGIDWLREQLAPYFAPPLSGELLYISRTDAKQRALLNEPDLVRELGRLGFRAATPGKLSVSAQIEAFSAARGIVGPHGAGMVNIVFAPAGMQVVELNSTRLAHMPDFMELALAREQRYAIVLSDDYGPEHGASVRANRDYRIDVPRVVNIARRLMGPTAGGS